MSGMVSQRTKQDPVAINYTVGGKRVEKSPDTSDLALIQEAESLKPQYWVPDNPVPDGFNLSQPKRSHKVDRAYKFFSARNLNVLATIRHAVFIRIILIKREG
jgi:hypothetical protein